MLVCKPKISEHEVGLKVLWQHSINIIPDFAGSGMILKLPYYSKPDDSFDDEVNCYKIV